MCQGQVYGMSCVHPGTGFDVAVTSSPRLPGSRPSVCLPFALPPFKELDPN